MLQIDNNPYITQNVSGRSGLIVLNRPKALNALNYAMVKALLNIFERWKDDPAISHVVICSDDSRAFCVGGDIRQVRENINAGNAEAADLFFQGEYLLDLAIAEFGKPVIALCDGLVMGGGAGLAQHSSHIVMTELTRFSMPECNIGLFPDVGASLFLGRCPIAVAQLLGMTGHVVDGATCNMLGLADAIVPSKKIHTLRQAILDCETAMIDEVIESYKIDPGLSLLSQNLPIINRIFGSQKLPEEMQERAKYFHRLRPNDTFIKQVVRAFAVGCPFSIKLFWRLLQVTEKFTTADQAISLDYHLALRIIRRPDFVEGVRALLVDKDNEPNWAPNRLDLVDDALLAEAFCNDGLPPLR